MDNTGLSRSHSWSDGDTPHVIKQDGKMILHHRCQRCGRDFVQGLDGAGWHAAYIGLLKMELLADEQYHSSHRRSICSIAFPRAKGVSAFSMIHFSVSQLQQIQQSSSALRLSFSLKLWPLILTMIERRRIYL